MKRNKEEKRIEDNLRKKAREILNYVKYNGGYSCGMCSTCKKIEEHTINVIKEIIDSIYQEIPTN